MQKPLVLFVILHEISVLNASFRLARDLENDGKEVKYIGLPDSEQTVRSNGFSFHPVFQQQFPLGSATKLGFEDLSQLGLIRYLRIFPERIKLFKLFTEYLLAGGDGEFITLLKNINPNIIVFSGSPYVDWVMLMAHPFKITSVYLHATFLPCENSGLPPAFTSLIPKGNSFWERLKILLAWNKEKILAQVRYAGFQNCAERLAGKYGLKISRYRHDSAGFKKTIGITVPELFAVHPEYDFFPVKVPGQHLIGPLVFHERKQPGFPWDRLDASRPLIYCTFGPHVWLGRDRYKVLYRTFMDTAARYREWQWVITTGYAANPDEFDSVPDNVVLVNLAPQAELLKRAGIFITHGGTCSVNECILHGVPMIVLPMGGDQYGNAARVAYHGLGVRGDIDQLSVPYLSELMETIKGSSYFRSQIKLMQKKFLEMEAERPAVKLINSLFR